MLYYSFLRKKSWVNSKQQRRQYHTNSTSRSLNFTTISFFILFLCILGGGGAARTDTLSLLYLRPIALLSIIIYVSGINKFELNKLTAPFIFLSLLATIFVVQLIPMPIDYWRSMPGHGLFFISDFSLGKWKPISISPDRTVNSLVSLVVPLAALTAIQYFSSFKKSVLYAIVLGGLVSGGMAMAQLAFGEGSALYIYRLTTNGAVGLFSNPNHQAVLLSCLIPMIALWAADSPKSNLRRNLGATSLVCLILLLIMVTGSRSGLVTSLVGLFFAFALHDTYLQNTKRTTRRSYRIFYIMAFVIVLAIAALAIALGRNLAVTRLTGLDIAGDLRAVDLHIFVSLAKDYFPFGSGSGTFDPAFRIIEPASIVKKTYVNHAHNELIETVITLGLPGLSLLIVFTGWFVVALIDVLRVPCRDRDGYALLGGALIAIMMLASLTDYLLRTPLMSALFAVACAWLSMGSVTARDARQARAVVPQP